MKCDLKLVSLYQMYRNKYKQHIHVLIITNILLLEYAVENA
jgi:hypothetical protein